MQAWPLIRYNNIGQLVCTACNAIVKSEVLWNVHLQTKSHKQNVSSPPVDKSEAILELKRKQEIHSTHANSLAKKAKIDSGHTTEEIPKQSVPLKSCLKKPRLAEYSSSEEDNSDDNTDKLDETSNDSNRNLNHQSNALPADFFDSSTTAASETVEETSKVAANMSEALPEGFFDDPVMDAKVRQVEYKNKMEEEWDAFQKAMKEQKQVSEAIQEDEDEQTTLERNIGEIDEQMQNWREVDALQNQREELIQKKVEKMSVYESDGMEPSDVDENEFEEFLDWRSKTAWS